MKDHERLAFIIKEVNENVHSFANELGFDRSDGIRDIVKGTKKRKDGSIIGISKELAKKIVEKYPQYNIAWVCLGVGEMYNSPDIVGNSSSLDEISLHDLSVGQKLILQRLAKIEDFLLAKDQSGDANEDGESSDNTDNSPSEDFDVHQTSRKNEPGK